MIREIIAYSDGRLVMGDTVFTCALGKGGVTSDKREGDGRTPLGSFAIRYVMYRADRISAPETKHQLRAIEKNDGWCDDPLDPMYNKLIPLPYPARYEKLWREDHIYDIVVVLGYNDDPVIPGKGSAVFLHLARENYTPTEGCVALSLENMLRVLECTGPGVVFTIRQV